MCGTNSPFLLRMPAYCLEFANSFCSFFASFFCLYQIYAIILCYIIISIVYIFKSCFQHIGYLRWWGFLRMVLAGNKVKRLVLVNHTTKTVHHHFLFFTSLFLPMFSKHVCSASKFIFIGIPKYFNSNKISISCWFCFQIYFHWDSKIL